MQYALPSFYPLGVVPAPINDTRPVGPAGRAGGLGDEDAEDDTDGAPLDPEEAGWGTTVEVVLVTTGCDAATDADAPDGRFVRGLIA